MAYLPNGGKVVSQHIVPEIQKIAQWISRSFREFLGIFVFAKKVAFCFCLFDGSSATTVNRYELEYLEFNIMCFATRISHRFEKKMKWKRIVPLFEIVLCNELTIRSYLPAKVKVYTRRQVCQREFDEDNVAINTTGHRHRRISDESVLVETGGASGGEKWHSTRDRISLQQVERWHDLMNFHPFTSFRFFSRDERCRCCFPFSRLSFTKRLEYFVFLTFFVSVHFGIGVACTMDPERSRIKWSSYIW